MGVVAIIKMETLALYKKKTSTRSSTLSTMLDLALVDYNLHSY